MLLSRRTQFGFGLSEIVSIETSLKIALGWKNLPWRIGRLKRKNWRK